MQNRNRPAHTGNSAVAATGGTEEGLDWEFGVSKYKPVYRACIKYKRAIYEEAMAPHSSTFAWKIPWAEEPSGLQSMAVARGGHD